MRKTTGSPEIIRKGPDNSKVKNILKGVALALGLTLSACGSTNPENQPTPTGKIIVIKKGQTLSQIVNDSIITPNNNLSKEQKSEWKLRKDIIDEIAKENNLEDPNLISENDTLKINMDSINGIIKLYLDNNQGSHDKQGIPNIQPIHNEGNINQGTFEQGNTIEQGISNQPTIKEQGEKVEDPSYTTIHSIEEFKKSDNYLIKKIFKDKKINGKFLKALKDGYTIKFLNSRETKDFPSLSLDEITKPKEIIGEELKGKRFTLDPGHGSLDTGAIGLAQYGNEANKEKIAVYESAVMMDLAYRIARELRSHGAEVNLTHYMNRRGIMDVKDLPPCSRVFDDEGKEVFQDIWDGIEKDSKGTFFNADGKYLTKRAKLSNNHNPNLLVSLHADMLRSGNKIDDKTKILSIKYDERQKNNESKVIADQLLNNGFGYYFNGKLAGDVKRDVVKQHLGALKPAKSPAILIEFGNISQESQAYILREYSKREELAKNFVASLIKVYKK